MLLQGYGIQRDEACSIASLPLPFSPSDESPGSSEAIKIAESFGLFDRPLRP
jgi:hypothetical protein